MKGNIELSNRAKAAYEAFAKIQQGQRLLDEGRLELEHLLGKDRSRNVTKTVEKMLPPKKRTKRLTANRTVRKKVGGRNRIDPIVEKERQDIIFNVVRNNDWVGMKKLEAKVGFSKIPIRRALKALIKEQKIAKVMKKGDPSLTDHRTKARLIPYWEAV